jgi:hypothetical protein
MVLVDYSDQTKYGIDLRSLEDQAVINKAPRCVTHRLLSGSGMKLLYGELWGGGRGGAESRDQPRQHLNIIRLLKVHYTGKLTHFHSYLRRILPHNGFSLPIIQPTHTLRLQQRRGREENVKENQRSYKIRPFRPKRKFESCAGREWLVVLDAN